MDIITISNKSLAVQAQEGKQMKRKIKKQMKYFVWGCIVFSWIVFLLAPISPIEVPFEVIAYGLMAVVGSYTAIDELASVVATRSLPKGFRYSGNREKLFR